MCLQNPVPQCAPDGCSCKCAKPCACVRSQRVWNESSASFQLVVWSPGSNPQTNNPNHQSRVTRNLRPQKETKTPIFDSASMQLVASICPLERGVQPQTANPCHQFKGYLMSVVRKGTNTQRGSTERVLRVLHCGLVRHRTLQTGSAQLNSKPSFCPCE